ncbi:MAG: hypothetical protein JRJ85_11310 [Deltaproteobacteria bacterium]|nr:hypothetical protein [Deltaproteobacteria bacterium]
MKTDKELMIQASRVFLIEELPQDYDEMTERGLLEYIGDNLWEPFENLNTEDVLGYIRDSAFDLGRFSNENS